MPEKIFKKERTDEIILHVLLYHKNMIAIFEYILYPSRQFVSY